MTERRHVADEVFDQLARAILEGDFAPGTALPSERDLEKRLGVSRIIARQALHRLAEMGLVRVRQGGATVVLDPDEVTDLRVLALWYRLTGKARSAVDVADMVEKQYLQGLSIVETATRRATADDLRRLGELLDAARGDTRVLSRFAELEERFWRALSVAGKNRIFRMEVAWWYEMLPERPVPEEVASADPAVRLEFYRELVRRIAAREHAAEYYLATTRPLLDAVMRRAIDPAPVPAPSAARHGRTRPTQPRSSKRK